MIQQVWHNPEKHFGANLDLSIGDGGCEMRLSAARRTAQQQPPRWMFRVVAASLERVRELLFFAVGGAAFASIGEEGLELSVRQGAHLAAPPQPITYFVAPAFAGDGAAEIRVADRDVVPDEPVSLTDRTDRLRLRHGVLSTVLLDGPLDSHAPENLTQGSHGQARYISRSRNLVVRSRNRSCTWPVGPLRCLATMMSATPFLSVSG